MWSYEIQALQVTQSNFIIDPCHYRPILRPQLFLLSFYLNEQKVFTSSIHIVFLLAAVSSPPPPPITPLAKSAPLACHFLAPIWHPCLHCVGLWFCAVIGPIWALMREPGEREWRGARFVLFIVIFLQCSLLNQLVNELNIQICS